MGNKYRDLIDNLAMIVEKNNHIKPEYYDKYNVKRGLRNNNGTGVLVGLTEVGSVHGYKMENNIKIPMDGKLFYRGLSIKDIVSGFQRESRHCFEE